MSRMVAPLPSSIGHLPTSGATNVVLVVEEVDVDVLELLLDVEVLVVLVVGRLVLLEVDVDELVDELELLVEVDVLLELDVDELEVLLDVDVLLELDVDELELLVDVDVLVLVVDGDVAARVAMSPAVNATL